MSIHQRDNLKGQTRSGRESTQVREKQSPCEARVCSLFTQGHMRSKVIICTGPLEHYNRSSARIDPKLLEEGSTVGIHIPCHTDLEWTFQVSHRWSVSTRMWDKGRLTWVFDQEQLVQVDELHLQGSGAQNKARHMKLTDNDHFDHLLGSGWNCISYDVGCRDNVEDAKRKETFPRFGQNILQFDQFLHNRL